MSRYQCFWTFGEPVSRHILTEFCLLTWSITIWFHILYSRNFKVSILLINNQLDAQFFSYMYLFRFSTCFEQPFVHHQESQLYQNNIRYMSLCVGDRPVCRSGRFLPDLHCASRWLFIRIIQRCTVTKIQHFSKVRWTTCNLKYSEEIHNTNR
jgi:hypothetical protein